MRIEVTKFGMETCDEWVIDGSFRDRGPNDGSQDATSWLDVQRVDTRVLDVMVTNTGQFEETRDVEGQSSGSEVTDTLMVAVGVGVDVGFVGLVTHTYVNGVWVSFTQVSDGLGGVAKVDETC